HYTPQTMSNMTKVLTGEVNAFKSRALNDKYVAIFMDATYIPLTRQTVYKEEIYIDIGIREEVTKAVLIYAIATTEATYVENELLQDINSRGVQEVLLFITDGLKGMKDTIHQIYPKAKYQHCCIHVSRNIAHKVRVKDRKEICDDFKAVYQANSKEEANTFLSSMIEKWKKNYPKVTQSLIENQDLLTFYDFPPSIRRTIYSTNLIESFNKQIKRYSRRKEQFQNEESLERFLVSIFDTYNQKFLNRSHKGFQQVTDTLVSMFTE
ncbi:transposase, partial [Enterococcus faecium]|uniref:IS256 family transposase n=1 Tax=Enterococcus faecium TaxID=1352 RepID=UPI000763C81B